MDREGNRGQHHQYDTANKYVFKCRLKVDSDDADVTNDGKLFHARAAATGKARSPIVLRRVTGTTTAVVELERVTYCGRVTGEVHTMSCVSSELYATTDLIIDAASLTRNSCSIVFSTAETKSKLTTHHKYDNSIDNK